MSEQMWGDMFNDCLDRMIAGENIDSCLRDYPNHADTLRPMLEVAATVRRAQLPRAEVLADQDAVWQRIQAAPVRRRGGRAWGVVYRIAALLLVVGFVLTLLTVMASDSLPGDRLYGWKQVSEAAQLAVSPDDDALKERFYQRRIEEAQSLIAKQRVEEVTFEGELTQIEGETWVVENLEIRVPVELVNQQAFLVGQHVEVTGMTNPAGYVDATAVVSTDPISVLPITPIPPTYTPEPTATSSATTTASPTTSQTATTTPTASITVTQTPSQTATATATQTQIPSLTSTQTPTRLLPTATSTPTVTPSGIPTTIPTCYIDPQQVPQNDANDVVIEGRIQAIDDNIVTINSLKIVLSPDDPMLQRLRVDEDVRIEGDFFFHTQGNNICLIVYEGGEYTVDIRTTSAPTGNDNDNVRQGDSNGGTSSGGSGTGSNPSSGSGNSGSPNDNAGNDNDNDDDDDDDNSSNDNSGSDDDGDDDD